MTATIALPPVGFVYDPPTLDERAEEAARLSVSTLFPAIYADDPNRPVPHAYVKIARIIIQAIEEGLV